MSALGHTYVPTGIWDVQDKVEVLAPSKGLTGAALDVVHPHHQLGRI